jgi:hypothetical protein
VRAVPARRTTTVAIVTATAALAISVLAAGGVAKSSGCPSFSSQAGAQERFFSLGGTASQNVGGLDDDGDGVACEGLSGPYAGYATIGYNRGKGFLFGTASMPPTGAGDGFACLAGNRHFPDGPRLLKIYKAVPGPDRAVSRDVGTAARPGSGRLVWKLDREPLTGGRYYVVFEERIRTSPYAPSDCPEFRSREVYLPRVQGTTPSPHSGQPRRPPLRAHVPR